MRIKRLDHFTLRNLVPRTVPDLHEHQIFASWTADPSGIARARKEAST